MTLEVSSDTGKVRETRKRKSGAQFWNRLSWRFISDTKRNREVDMSLNSGETSKVKVCLEEASAPMWY